MASDSLDLDISSLKISDKDEKTEYQKIEDKPYDGDILKKLADVRPTGLLFTEIPVKVCLPDGKTEEKSISFDEYFKTFCSDKYLKTLGRNAKDVTMLKRMKDGKPYNLFFNSLKNCSETKDQLYSISFTDLLCPSFGTLKCSLQINFMVDIVWLLEQYAARDLHNTPITIIHGSEIFPWPEKELMKSMYPNIDYHFVELKTRLGHHHSKLGIYVYDDDSLQVVMGSANLYRNDWDLFNQQIWISPSCPRLPEGSSTNLGDSPTGFKSALLEYLSNYNDFGISDFDDWIDRIKMADFSDVMVVLVYSVPGVHEPRRNGSHLYYLGHVLSRECSIPAPKKEHSNWKIVAQTSSLGKMGENEEEWLRTHVLKTLGSNEDLPYLPSMRSICSAGFGLVYPTMQNVLDGYLGPLSAACSHYEKGVLDQQPWLKNYMYQWKADETKRSRAISHAKCYFRVSPCWTKMAYYLLTTANMSRSGWGVLPNQDATLFVRSYELGILFLPKCFGEAYFEVRGHTKENKRFFPVTFDLPPTPYSPDDEPYSYNILVEKELVIPEPGYKPSYEPPPRDRSRPSSRRPVFRGRGGRNGRGGPRGGRNRGGGESHPREDNSNPRYGSSNRGHESPHSRYGSSNSINEKGPHPRYGSPNPRYFSPIQRRESPNTRYGDSNSKINRPSPRYGSPNPRYESPNPRYGSPNPRREIPHSSYGGSNSRINRPSPRYEGPNRRYDSPNSKYGSPGRESPHSRFSSSNTRYDRPNPRNASPNPRYDSPNSRCDSPSRGRKSPHPRYNNPNSRYDSPNSRKSSNPRYDLGHLRNDSPDARTASPNPRRDGSYHGRRTSQPRYERSNE